MFNEKKVLQIISYLLSLNNGKMSKLKLIKELYLIDRMSIDEDDVSLSGDDFFSLPHGPVLSLTLNIINDIPDNTWAEYLEIKGKNTIHLIKEFDEGRLSKRDKYFIETVSEKYKDYSPSQLRNFSHTLSEWRDPKGSNRKIRFADIMKALGKSDEEIAEAKAEYDNISKLYASIGIR